MDADAALALLMGNAGKKKRHHRKKPRIKRPRRQKPLEELLSKFRFPTDRDVATFAQELGMDLEFDSEQQWLIDQALASELPPLWTRVYNPSGRSYYVREPTKQEPHEIVTWSHPLVPAYSKIFDNILQEQLEAQKAALGIVSDEDEEEDEGETDIFIPSTPGAPKLSHSQRKKLRASLEDALLYYKSKLGDPGTEDVRPNEEVSGYWDCEPEDVEDMAVFLGIAPIKESRLMWISRMACVAPLPPGWKAHGHGDDISVLCAENKSVSLNDIGELYSCKSWMCKTDAIIAKMALEMHPSHQYFEQLLLEAREEAAGDEEGGDDGYDDNDEFGDLEEVIECEFRNETGGVYVYDFKTEEIRSTGRKIQTPEEEEEQEEQEEQERRQEEEKEKEEIDDNMVSTASTNNINNTNNMNNVSSNTSTHSNTIESAPTFTKEVLQQLFREFDHDHSGSITSVEFCDAFDRLEMNSTELNFDVETFVHRMDDNGDGTVNFAEFVVAIERLTTKKTKSNHQNSAEDKITIIEDDGTVIATPTPTEEQHSSLMNELINTTFGATIITKDQVIDFATHIGLDIHNHKDVRFHYILIDCFKNADIGPGWMYRTDPNGNYHYYKNLKDHPVDLTKGEEPSGWGADDNMEMERTMKEDQKIKDINDMKDKNDKDPLTQSSWKHPKVTLYQKKYSHDKKEYLEDLRIQRVKGLRTKSTITHVNKMKLAKHAGGQHIIMHGPSGEDVSLSAPTHNVSIQRPKTAEMQSNLVSPSKRTVPLQPGFSDVQIRKLKKEKAAAAAAAAAAANQDVHGTQETMLSGRAHSPIQDLLRSGQRLDGKKLSNPANVMHRAFRNCTLSDTAEEKREREEERRQKRRKKRKDHSKSKREQMKRTLDERARIAKSKSSPNFPPLQLDARTNLGVISLSMREKEKKQQEFERKQKQQRQAKFIRDDQYSDYYAAAGGSSSGGSGVGGDNSYGNGNGNGKSYGGNRSSSDEEGGKFYDDGYRLPSPKMKGILSPSHQGRFAACGNLVPVSTELFSKVQDKQKTNLSLWGGRNRDSVSQQQQTIDDYKLQQYKKDYDASFEEENDVIDQWLLKKRYDGDENGEKDDGSNSNSNTKSVAGGKVAMTISFSVGVTKAITLAPSLRPTERLPSL
jgi:hypothetical protein